MWATCISDPDRRLGSDQTAITTEVPMAHPVGRLVLAVLSRKLLSCDQIIQRIFILNESSSTVFLVFKDIYVIFFSL
ncbi:hypothetical protein Patl1_30897 [Pistacia atlantica]|uniref:Uncharacterized protein n=1 Tax=Pistacia atlantica TaxID=434234 RepID=A0ACC1AC87_9ROSI|nr:hypothetical protein Patl1_30897 [Pistacia atlantica]